MTVFKEDELEEVQAEVQSFIGRWVRQFPEADKSVLEFIATVCCHGGTGHSADIIHDLFRAGFCYYFAKMLEDAFPGGEVCWAAPYSHIVYNYNGICYDIEGIYMGAATEIVPVRFMGDCLYDFRHIPGKRHKTTINEINSIIETCHSSRDAAQGH